MEMAQVQDEFLTYSRYIRDTLQLLVARHGQAGLNKRDISNLHSVLNIVYATPITPSLLFFSRIDKAMMTITENPANWPADIVSRAQGILHKWTATLGSMDRLEPDLWVHDRGLEGIRNPGNLRRSGEDSSKQLPWVAGRGFDNQKAYQIGNNGFMVGAWWINEVAAFRDGIVDGSNHSITANEHSAYAVILKYDQELNLEEDGKFRFITSNADPGALKLAKTIYSHSIVRILRSWTLHSRLAPTAGLRYDGVYRVTGYGMRLFKDKNANDLWKYTFEFTREPDQASIKDALCHPTAEELDDWEIYQLSKATKEQSVAQLDHSETADLTEKERTERQPSFDSGYLSGRNSESNATGEGA